MTVDTALCFSIVSTLAITALLVIAVLSDMLGDGELVERVLTPFLIAAAGFLMFTFPAAHDGGIVNAAMGMAVAVIADAATLIGLAGMVIDALTRPQSSPVPISRAYVQVVSRENASDGTGSGSCHGHAPVQPTASRADGRYARGSGCDGTRACPNESAGGSNE